MAFCPNAVKDGYIKSVKNFFITILSSKQSVESTYAKYQAIIDFTFLIIYCDIFLLLSNYLIRLIVDGAIGIL